MGTNNKEVILFGLTEDYYKKLLELAAHYQCGTNEMLRKLIDCMYDSMRQFG